MVSLYFDGRINESVHILLIDSTPEGAAFVSPWLYVFGREATRRVVGQQIELFLSASEEKQAVITLEAISQALMSSISISELEDSRVRFSGILGPKIANQISTDSRDLIAASAKAITNIFSQNDYCDYFPPLETIGAVDMLANMLQNCQETQDPMVQTNHSIILAKLAEFGNPKTVDKVFRSIPMKQLADLLSPDAEEWHESIFTTLMSLTRAGKSKAAEKMFSFGIDKTLIKLVEVGSEVSPHHAIVTLKATYEIRNTPADGSLRPGILRLLPWQARVILEKLVISDQNVPPTQKPQTFEDLVYKVLGNDNKHILEALQDLIPMIEKAGDPVMRDMILQSPLVKRLSELLHHGKPDNCMKSESAFLLMKHACAGGEPCIKQILEYDIVPDLVKMMQQNVPELQDSAYTVLHQMLFGKGSVLIRNRILEMGLVEKLIHSMESTMLKTREVNVHCVLDIVEVGNKACLERMLSLQVVEKLIRIEKASGGTGENVVGFLKGVDKCKHLSKAERRVMKQQVVRKVRAALKGHKFEAQILAAVDACLSESQKGSASGSGRRRK